MKKLTVALLAGGVSSEREVSLHSGEQVYEALDKDKYNILKYDPQSDLARLVQDAPKIDIAMIILHGPFGEDGTVQGLLELLNIPYQGSGVLGSALAMNKSVTKQLYEKAGLPMLPYIVYDRDQSVDVAECADRIGLPMVVKPVEAGSSVGMSIVKSAAELQGALEKAGEFDNAILVESFIKGTELTAGVLGNKELDALPLIEIIPDKSYEFFDYEAKYKAGATQEICPARISEELTGRAQDYAKIAHRTLFCKGYSRTDMILKDEELYVLETNTIPGMTATSLYPQAAQEAGMSFSQVLDKLIELGLEE
ncbi:MAG: D-alanine--D-alanine ligase [bacterium]|nr:D-alanine--D-alanine ligase [bacterium]